MSESGIRVDRANIGSSEAFALISALNAELSAAYADVAGANHFRLDVDEVSPGRGAYVIAWRHATPVGCGAIRRIDETTAEIKRMYVVPSARGAGIGRQIVAALENEARGLGVTRILLETGTRQTAAIALYEKLGFEPIQPYGEYVASAATSVCMAKRV